jgi:hypothetical protein
LGPTLLAKGATDVAPDGGIVLEEVLCLLPVEQAGGFERLLEVLEVRDTFTGLSLGSAVGHDHYLLPVALSVLVPLIAVMLGQSGVIAIVPIAEVAGGLGLATEVGLDGLLTGGILGACGLTPSAWTRAS